MDARWAPDNTQEENLTESERHRTALRDLSGRPSYLHVLNPDNPLVVREVGEQGRLRPVRYSIAEMNVQTFPEQIPISNLVIIRSGAPELEDTNPDDGLSSTFDTVLLDNLPEVRERALEAGRGEGETPRERERKELQYQNLNRTETSFITDMGRGEGDESYDSILMMGERKEEEESEGEVFEKTEEIGLKFGGRPARGKFARKPIRGRLRMGTRRTRRYNWVGGARRYEWAGGDHDAVVWEPNVEAPEFVPSGLKPEELLKSWVDGETSPDLEMSGMEKIKPRIARKEKMSPGEISYLYPDSFTRGQRAEINTRIRGSLEAGRSMSLDITMRSVEKDVTMGSVGEERMDGEIEGGVKRKLNLTDEIADCSSLVKSLDLANTVGDIEDLGEVLKDRKEKLKAKKKIKQCL